MAGKTSPVCRILARGSENIEQKNLSGYNDELSSFQPAVHTQSFEEQH